MPHTTLSTGAQIRDDGAFNANVVVLNLDPKVQRTVTVEVFDWGVEQLWSTPKTVPVSPAGPTPIGAHTQRAFLALITQSTTQPGSPLVLYEIRVTVDNVSDVVVNCFTVDNNGQTIGPKTVWHRDLVAIPAL